MTAPCRGRVPSLPSTAPPAEVVRDHPWPGFALWRGRFWSIPESPTPLTPRSGVGSTPVPDSTPSAGRATTAEVEGASRRASRLAAIPRWSWSLVDRLGKFVREYGLVAFLAIAVPLACGLMLAASAAGRTW